MRESEAPPSRRGHGSASAITIVSGVPRSGTSMMMKMLDAGGVALLTDGLRQADEDNPTGYYELDAVKRLGKEEPTWLDGAAGGAVKIISRLLYELPSDRSYRVLFMHRDLDEVLASQRQMLIRRGEGGGGGDDTADDVLKAAFERHVSEVTAWLRRQANFQVLEVQFADVHADPRSISRCVDDFLDGGLAIDRMAAVVDAGLYRQRLWGGCSGMHST